MAKVSYKVETPVEIDKDISAYLVIVPDITIPTEYVDDTYLTAYDLGSLKRLPVDLNLVPKQDLILDELLVGFDPSKLPKEPLVLLGGRIDA